MARTGTKDIICIYLTEGWKGLKPGLKALAKRQSDPALRTVSGLCRYLIARKLNFKPDKESK